MPLPPSPEFHPVANPGAIIREQNARFSILTSRLLRLEFSPGGVFEDRPSQAFWYREQPVPVYSSRTQNGKLEIETEHLVLSYHPSSSGFTHGNLSITMKESGITWRPGMSQRANLKGTARTLDGAGGATRLENGLLSRDGWALVDDSRSLVFDETGWLQERGIRARDLYFFGYGTDVAACLMDFTKLAGKIPMIPRYILGNWWSRYWEYSAQDLQTLMEDFKTHQVPLSVCIVDMDWHITRTGNSSDGWTGYTWNRELFPDPAGFMTSLHEQGLRTALNLHPARGVHPHEEQYAEMARWMGMDPDKKKPVEFDISDRKFAEGYFEILHHPQEAAGVDFWWMDWQQGKKSKLTGLDPLWWLNHLHYLDLGRDGRKRPFVFSRWGGLGNHRTPIGFSGDTYVLWRALAYQPYFTATAANVGYGWWSHDIGGHMMTDGTPELYLRWVQFGVFSPIFRLHSTKRPDLDRRPWGKPEQIYLAAREAMQLRHALIPYIYSMAWRAHNTGISLVTPMYYEDMQREEAFQARDQYYFGSELLVAPIIRAGDPWTGVTTRKVWFPDPAWTNFFTGEKITAAGWQEIQAALEDIPVYARAGAIIPMAKRPHWGGIENPGELDIHVFPGEEREFLLYEDDGETTGYLAGEFAITKFSLGDGVFTIHAVEGDASKAPAERVYRIRLRGVSPDMRASLPAHYEPATRSLVLEAVRLTPTETLTVTFK